MMSLWGCPSTGWPRRGERLDNVLLTSGPVLAAGQTDWLTYQPGEQCEGEDCGWLWPSFLEISRAHFRLNTEPGAASQQQARAYSRTEGRITELLQTWSLYNTELCRSIKQDGRHQEKDADNEGLIITFSRSDNVEIKIIFQVETDDLYKKIEDMEQFTKDTNKESDKFDADIRDASKKVQKQETSLEETMEKLQQSASKMEEAEKEFKDKDDDVNAAARRCVLMEEEVRINTEKLASTVHKLANMSKDADKIVKGMREWENKTMNNEVEIEELDKNMRSARSIGEI